MSEAAAARVYAEALYEVAADRDKVPAIAKEVEAFADALHAHGDLQAVLSSPRVGPEQKRSVLDEIFAQIEPEMLNFLKLLVDRGRFHAFGAIAELFLRQVDRSAGRVKALAVSARALNKKEIKRIAKAVAGKSGSEVQLDARVDPRLLGGVIIRVGDQVLDGSVRTRLATIRRGLTETRTPADLWEGDIDDTLDSLRNRFVDGEDGPDPVPA